MRQNGNVSVNKIYNPKNTRPGIPMDVDEVDMAMERFVRQKYQERSLADGKPRPPSRDEVGVPSRSPPSRSPQASPAPSIHLQPPKRGKIFGFKLRASSSAYPASKRETRNLPPLEPTVENAFRTELNSNKPSKPRVSDSAERDKEKEEKLAALREMGFPDDKRNSAVLTRLSGDMSRTVESLVRLGEGGPGSRKTTPGGSKTSTPSRATFPDDAQNQAPNTSGNSNNPFDPPARANTLAVPQVQGQRAVSYNPFDVQNGPHSAFQPVDQAFEAMHISQPLFPHSTGGYPVQQPPFQDPRFQHSMTPPIPHVSQQYGYTPSPPVVHNTNPFFQSMQPQNAVTYDTYGPSQINAPFSAPATNPFFNQSSAYEAAQAPLQSAPLQAQASYSNPFGIPPSPQSAPPQQHQYAQTFDNQPMFSSTSSAQPSFYQQQDPQFQVQSLSQSSTSSISSQQGPYQQSTNPYQAQFQSQISSPYQPQPSPMYPQPTNRFDKKSILALYNYPHLAPQPMPTIPDDPNPSAKTPPSTSLSATPQQTSTSNLLSTNPSATSPRRSATMPISPITTTSNPASRNPFLIASSTTSTSTTNDTSRQSSALPSPAVAHLPLNPSPTLNLMHHHASQESVSIANLESGRHSPDAFASLSARFVRG
jgi:hypothetical protein